MGVIIILYFRSVLFFGTFSTGKSPAAELRHPLTNHVLCSDIHHFAGEVGSDAYKLRWGKYSFLSPDFSDVITQFAKELVLEGWVGGYGQSNASDVSKLIKAGLPAQGVNGRIHQSSQWKVYSAITSFGAKGEKDSERACLLEVRC